MLKMGTDVVHHAHSSTVTHGRAIQIMSTLLEEISKKQEMKCEMVLVVKLTAQTEQLDTT